MPEPAAPRNSAIRAPLRPSANGSARPLPAPAARRRPTRIAGIRRRLIAGIGALVLLVIFIVQNTQTVHITFLGAHATVPLTVALLITAVIAGALVMAIAGTARISELRRIMRQTRRRGRTHAAVSDTHRGLDTGPARPKSGPQP